MKSFKTLAFIFATIVASSLSLSVVSAATIPLPNVPVYIKSASTSRIFNATTDSNGLFSFYGTEDSGFYNLFVNDESMSPIRMQAHKGTVSGRVVILTDGTTTQDPPKLITKLKSTIKKVSVPIKKNSATSTKY